MKTKLNLLAAAIFLAALRTGFGQPIITNLPQSCTNVVGTTATFAVGATGTEPLAYRWQKYSYDLADRTNATLVLTNLVSGDAGDYCAVVTNIEGAVTSTVARLTVLVPPRITPTTSLQHQAIHVGSNALFAVQASGVVPLSYQWRLDGRDLAGQTSNYLRFSAVQPADEGDYTVVVTNVGGSVTSDPARLWVVPPPSAFIRGNFTNGTFRFPYYYLMPTNFSSARLYPLVSFFHGGGGDEILFTNPVPGWAGYANFAETKVLASYRQQTKDPAIVVWPTPRAGEFWNDTYTRQATNLIDALIAKFNIDTNRVYLGAASAGGPTMWDLMGIRRGFFAGALLVSSTPGSKPAALIRDVPLWVFETFSDESANYLVSRSFVQQLRLAGGNPIYTEYLRPGHVDACLMMMRTPVAVDWLLAQRRGVAPTNEPFLSITNPTSQAVLSTGATNLNLAGTAAALGQVVTQVTWTNFANNAKGVAMGTNLWSATTIPLVANRTNVVVVVGTTSTSWAPAYGGNTTFNDTLAVIQAPLRATLALQATNALLNWTGGGAPYHVQRASNLAPGGWTDYLPNATPPVTLPLDGQAGFYRIVGQ
jgi:hypothetical protein